MCRTSRRRHDDQRAVNRRLAHGKHWFVIDEIWQINQWGYVKYIWQTLRDSKKMFFDGRREDNMLVIRRNKRLRNPSIKDWE